MIVEYLAVLVYGVLSMVFAALLALMVGSPIAMALATAAAGVTYLFQVSQLHSVTDEITLRIMMGLSILLTIASVLVSLGSYFNVL